MSNSWYKQAYIQGFYCEYINFKKFANIFEHMEIADSIYEGVIEPLYKNLPGQTTTVLITAGKIEEKPPRRGIDLRRLRVLSSAENDM